MKTKNFDLTKSINQVKKSVNKYSPEILTGFGIAGMCTTIILAVKATPKAVRLLEDKKYELEKDKLTAVETVKTSWKCYAPAAITGAASVACIIGASSVNAKRNTALATAYELSKTAFAEYREKVVETIGEKKEEKVRDEIAKDKLKKKPASGSEIIVTGKGESLCYDTVSGRTFKCDIEKLKKTEIELNRQIIGGDEYVSLNEFYHEIGLPGIGIGDDIGWNTDSLIELKFSAQLDDNDTPCLVLDYYVEPRYDFRKLM